MTPWGEDVSALAREALEQPRGPARDRLVAGIQALLLPKARALCRQRPDLARLGEPEDLVHAFLADKVLPERTLRILLAPVVAEPGRLRPRLLASFENYSESALRRRDPLRQATPLTPDDRARRPNEGRPPPGVAPDEVRVRLGEGAAALRREFPAPERGVPLGACLLLELRLSVAAGLARHLGPTRRQPERDATVCDLVESALPWGPEDEGRRLTHDGRTLGWAWQEVLRRTGRRPQAADRALVAGLLGVTPECWSTWTYRGRGRLRARLGPEETARLFPGWAAGESRTARGEGGRE